MNNPDPNTSATLLPAIPKIASLGPTRDALIRYGGAIQDALHPNLTADEIQAIGETAAEIQLLAREIDPGPVERLAQDLALAAQTMIGEEARFLVHQYYDAQAQRITANSQLNQLVKKAALRAEKRAARPASHQPKGSGAAPLKPPEAPHRMLEWVLAQSKALEKQIGKALASYTQAHAVGRWACSIDGIGPVISAGLLAHINMDIADTAGHIWSFAGLAPGVTWEKGQRRPWNADLKALCWKIGESFVKVSNKEGAYYGAAYKSRKAYEWRNNLNGSYSDEATKWTLKLKSQSSASMAWYKGEISPPVVRLYMEHGQPFTEGETRLVPSVAEIREKRIPLKIRRVLQKINPETDWEADLNLTGVKMLPPGHIHSRAKRWTVKLFLAHWHEVAYRDWWGSEPPAPYPIAKLGHKDYEPPPNYRLGEGETV